MTGDTRPGGLGILRAAVLASVALLAGCAGVPAAPNPTVALNGSEQERQAAFVRLARAAREAGDIASAAALYRNAVAKGAEPSTSVEFGDTLFELASFDEAAKAYGSVAENAPARAAALLGLLKIELKLGRPNRAVFYADQAIALAPRDARAITGRGIALDMLGQHAEAQKCYREVLAAKHDDLAARNDLALSLALSSEFDEAIGLLGPAALSATATSKIRQNLALIYALKGERGRAAALSRVDLDEDATASNLALLDLVRAVSAQSP